MNMREQMAKLAYVPMTMSHEPAIRLASKLVELLGYPARVYFSNSGSEANEAAFKTASRQCFRQAFESASPVMLEPIFDLEVMCPDDYTGDVMSDLNTRRARIQGT